MIYLIGCSHFDIDGYSRLLSHLTNLKPEQIGLETTNNEFFETCKLVKSLSNPNVFDTALRNAKIKFSNSNEETLRLWLSSTQYVTRAIMDYKNPHNIVFCDSDEELDNIEVEGKNDSLELEEFLIMTPNDARKNLEEEYSQAQYPVNDCEDLKRFYQSRDALTETVLRGLEGKIVYICGLDHIFGDYNPNLFDRLNNLNPIRIRLNSKISEI